MNLQETPAIDQRSDQLFAKVRELVVAVLNGDDSRNRARRAVISVFCIRVASAALVYLSQIAMARWMGSFDYGIYVFVWAWVLILGGLAPGGLALSVIRLFPQHLEHGETNMVRGILLYGRLFVLGLSTSLAIIAVGTLYLLSDFIPEHYLLPLVLSLACVPLLALSDMHDGIGRARSWIWESLLPSYVLRPITLLAVLAGTVWLGLPVSATTAVVATIVALGLSLLIQFSLIEWRIRGLVPAGPTQANVGLWTRTSLPLFMISGCDLLMQYADVLVISAYLQPNEVGVYFAAAKTMALILFVHYAVGSATANQFATLSARGDNIGLERAARDAVALMFWPSLLFAVLLLLLGQPLLRLFGPSFTDGYPIMLILVFGYLFRAATGPADFLLNMAGEQLRSAYVFGSAALLNVGLNILLVPHFGTIGAATGMALSLVFVAILQVWLVYRRLGIRMWIGASPTLVQS
ncbi:MAG: polysaccharide biosynthesis C-terminal domain-containing protein [Pseudomonadota bacterium]